MQEIAFFRIRQALLGFVVLSFVGVPLFAYAAPVIRSGDAVVLSADQNVPGDFYTAGGTVSISGSVEGDLYTAGGTVTVNGPVSEDLVVAGGAVSLHGKVGDDVRVAGGQVTIAGEIEGDLIVFAGTLSVLSTAKIAGDVLFYGGTADIGGPVGGSIHTYAQTLRVDSAISGDITATVGDQFNLGPAANVGGGVAYRSGTEISRAPSSVVVGEIARGRFAETAAEPPLVAFPFFGMLATLFAVFALMLVFGSKLNGTLVSSTQSLGYNMLIGFGVLLLTPVAFGLLLVSVLGMFVGVLVLAVYIALVMLSWILAGVLAGAFLAKAFTHKYKITWLWALLGVVALHALSAIPFVGHLIVLVLAMCVLGRFVSILYAKVR